MSVAAPAEVMALVPLFLHGLARHSRPVRCRAGAPLPVRGRGVRDSAPVLPEGRHRAATAFEAADVVASALAALAIGGPGVILPHAAAVESPAGLVLLLADTTGGKSTLALTLAAAGWRLFGDDRLGLRREGRAHPESRSALPPSCACRCRAPPRVCPEFITEPRPAELAEPRLFGARIRRAGPARGGGSGRRVPAARPRRRPAQAGARAPRPARARARRKRGGAVALPRRGDGGRRIACRASRLSPRLRRSRDAVPCCRSGSGEAGADALRAARWRFGDGGRG